MSKRAAQYQVTLNTPATGKIHCGTLIIKESDGNTDGVGFKYSAEYLTHPNAFSIDPVALQLSSTAYQYRVNQSLPGFLDDYLPDQWGRRVIARAASVAKKTDFNANSVIDILSLVSKSNIGALAIQPENEGPTYDLGLEYEDLIHAENAALLINEPDNNITLETAKLIHLWREGSGGAGGARPKSLIHKGKNAYLAKFNTRQDEFNFAKVELACLRMAKKAGIKINDGFVEENINGRDVLLLKRFDVVNNDSRLHVVTINALLKNAASFADYGMMFRYNDIHNLLKSYSTNIQEDLKQLLRLMLFNRAINNSDDHERNFSLCTDGTGYKFAPAYDLVPSLSRGQFHAAGYSYSNYPLRPSEVDGKQRIFGVPKKEAKACAEEVAAAVEKWPVFADEAGVCEQDSEKINDVFNL